MTFRKNHAEPDSWNLLALALALTLAAAAGLIGGCDESNGFEEAGEEVDEALEDAGEALEDAGDEIEDATDDDDADLENSPLNGAGSANADNRGG
jgi:hypothetical protein